MPSAPLHTVQQCPPINYQLLLPTTTARGRFGQGLRHRDDAILFLTPLLLLVQFLMPKTTHIPITRFTNTRYTLDHPSIPPIPARYRTSLPKKVIVTPDTNHQIRCPMCPMYTHWLTRAHITITLPPSPGPPSVPPDIKKVIVTPATNQPHHTVHCVPGCSNILLYQPDAHRYTLAHITITLPPIPGHHPPSVSPDIKKVIVTPATRNHCTTGYRFLLSASTLAHHILVTPATHTALCHPQHLLL